MIRQLLFRFFTAAFLFCMFFNAFANTANFTASFVCEGSNTLFQSTSVASSGTITQWAWDFDYDGQFDDGSGQTVNYTFPGSGSYLVGLRITTDQNEVVQTYKTVYINPVAVAAFTSNAVCRETATFFADNSTIASGSLTGFAWDFDSDGNYDNGTGDSIDYVFPADGTFTVGFQVTSDSGCVSVTHAIVTVFPTPTANFSFSDDCLGDSTHFMGNGTVSSGSIVAYNWELNGDGQYNDATGASIYHEFINAGNYQVGLRVTSNKGCTKDTVALVVIAPIPYINYSFEGACTNTPVNFTNLSFSGVGTMSYTWNFGDGSATSNEVNPDHAYENAGEHTITLIGISSYGCSDTTSQNITINGTPISDFTAADVCHGAATVFINSSNPNGSVIESYRWNFDYSNAESVAANPVYLYSQPGTYNVSLVTYSTQGCIDTVKIDINVWANPVANIVAAGPTGFCIGGSVTISVDPGDANVLWSNASDKDSITVDVSGSYNVLLYDEHGCKDRDTIVITVYELPTITGGPDTTISAGFSAQLWVTGAETYMWWPGDYLDQIHVADPVSTPLQSIIYTVTGTDINGCVSSDAVTVTVNYDYNLVAYNLFSPNGDADNPYFEIMNLQLYPDCEVIVYNRLGSPVFSAKGYQNNWDGTYNGEPLPDATYYYVIKCEGTEKIFTGPVSILR